MSAVPLELSLDLRRGHFGARNIGDMYVCRNTLSESPVPPNPYRPPVPPFPHPSTCPPHLSPLPPVPLTCLACHLSHLSPVFPHLSPTCTSHMSTTEAVGVEGDREEDGGQGGGRWVGQWGHTKVRLADFGQTFESPDQHVHICLLIHIWVQLDNSNNSINTFP